jgi:hypothetical protein
MPQGDTGEGQDSVKKRYLAAPLFISQSICIGIDCT